MRLTIRRVVELPEETQPSTLYLTGTDEPDMLVAWLTDNTGYIIKHTPSRGGLEPRGNTLTDVGSGIYTIDCATQPAIFYLPPATGSQTLRVLSYIRATTHNNGALMPLSGDILNSVTGPVIVKEPNTLVVVDSALGEWTVSSINGDNTPGVDGERGPVGPVGPPGCVGPQGSPGPVGPAGNNGSNGVNGPQGDAGPMGPPGPASAIPGPAGPQGPQGADGNANGGNTGPQGAQGPQGQPGAAGTTGPQGPQGAAGSGGNSNLIITTHNDTAEANAGFTNGYIVYTTNDKNIWWMDAGTKRPLSHPVVSYDHEQLAPALVWNVGHNLGFIPSITVLDMTNTVIDASITHTDENNATVTLTTAITGMVLCR